MSNKFQEKEFFIHFLNKTSYITSDINIKKKKIIETQNGLKSSLFKQQLKCKF